MPEGRVIALANEAGQVTDRYRYTPCGTETPLDNSGNPFRYIGRRWDRELGLYYYRARYAACPGEGRGPRARAAFWGPTRSFTPTR